jgi:hypothetical protein
LYHNNNINNSQINYPIVIVFILCHLIFTIRQNRSSNHHIKLSRVYKSCDKKHDDRLYFMAFSLIVTLGNQMSYTSSKFGVSVYIKGSPRFLCCPMAFFFARSVGRQRALHKENSGFASPTLGRHISTFCGYRILFSIRNPYINRLTNHFSIHS